MGAVSLTADSTFRVRLIALIFILKVLILSFVGTYLLISVFSYQDLY